MKLNNNQPITDKNFSSNFNSMNKKLNEKNKKFVLVIDEIDNVYEKETSNEMINFLKIITSLNKNNDNVVLIVSGLSPELNENYIYPTYQIFNVIWLKGLDRFETDELITTIGLKLNLTYSENAINLIYEKTNGFPYLIRRICSLIYNKYKYINDTIKVSETNDALIQFLRSEQDSRYLLEIKDSAIKANEKIFFNLLLVYKSIKYTDKIDIPLNKIMKLEKLGLIEFSNETITLKLLLLSDSK